MVELRRANFAQQRVDDIVRLLRHPSYLAGKGTALPSGKAAKVKNLTIRGSIASLLRRHAHGVAMWVGRVLINALFDLGPEMSDQTLDRPGRRVPERADRMALDLFGDVEQHVDFLLLRAALGHAGHHAPHPTGALAARRALAAAFVHVEVGE